MSGEVEHGTCDVCKENAHLNRKYYYYDIQCECCGAKHNDKNVHFEIVWHCNKCSPKPPRKISAHIQPMP